MSSSSPPSFDALLPPEIAAKAEDIGAAKGRLDLVPMFMLAVLAGAFIALGAIFSTTVATGAGDLPFGVAKLLAGLAFCLGLILVVVAGAELFTGNNLLIMAYVSRKLSTRQLLRNWIIVYAGNFAGAIATAWVMFHTRQYTMDGGALGTVALRIASAKCDLGFVEALSRGIYCNALVCLAVWLCFSCRGTGEKILAIIFPITAFVACGFEHCVANMYFIPIGLFIKAWADPATLGDVVLDPLTWARFFSVNLLPVTIGNIIGGAGFVGVIYWVVYRRK